MIDGHASALVSDFQAHYGLRLAVVLFEWSPREVLALVEGLVAYEDSLYVAHAQGGDERWREFLGWGTRRHADADFYDLYVAAHTPQGKKAFTYPRPTIAPQPSQGTPFLKAFPRRRG